MSDPTFDPETGEIRPDPASRIPTEIAQAIIAVARRIRQLGVDDRNQHGGYNFVSVDKFYERIGALMAEAGLAVLIDEVGSELREGAKGNPWLFMRYNLRFMHDAGFVSPPLARSCALPISGPQAYGAAQSYVEKQFLRQVFKVPTGEKDADETVPSDGAPAGSPAPAPASRAGTRPAPTPAAPSDAAKDEARKRWRQLRDEINDSPSAADVEALLDCPAWHMMVEHVKKAEGANAEAVIEQLRERAGRRKAILAAEPATEEYQ